MTSDLRSATEAIVFMAQAAKVRRMLALVTQANSARIRHGATVLVVFEIGGGAIINSIQERHLENGKILQAERVKSRAVMLIAVALSVAIFVAGILMGYSKSRTLQDLVWFCHLLGGLILVTGILSPLIRIKILEDEHDRDPATQGGDGRGLDLDEGQQEGYANKMEQILEMIGNEGPPSPLYLFTHRILPDSLFQSPGSTLSTLNSGDGIDRLKQLLDSAFHQCGNPHMDFEFSITPIEDPKGVILTLPPPQEPADAYFVAFVETSEGHRYFTLAHGVSGGTMVCEWTQDQSHRNYGHGPVPDARLFQQTVRELVS